MNAASTLTAPAALDSVAVDSLGFDARYRCPLAAESAAAAAAAAAAAESAAAESAVVAGPHILAVAAKRTIDIVGALAGLLLAGPLLLIVAIAVRIEGGPGVIFRQERVGLGGRTFTLLKLRSLRPVGDEGDVRWNIAGDSRLGPVGRFIRKTSIDELPQLWNVLRGDMSLVGPRPERPHFVDQFSQTIPGYADRHRVKAGLTGLAVVNGLRGDTSIPCRAYFDNLYIDSWSLWLDITIMFRTLGRVVITGA